MCFFWSVFDAFSFRALCKQFSQSWILQLKLWPFSEWNEMKQAACAIAKTKQKKKAKKKIEREKLFCYSQDIKYIFNWMGDNCCVSFHCACVNHSSFSTMAIDVKLRNTKHLYPNINAHYVGDFYSFLHFTRFRVWK